MSISEKSSSSSSSSSGESKEIRYQQNRQIDRIIENLLLRNHNLTSRTPPTRRRRYCDREREAGDQRLMNNYFAPNPKYSPELFRLRFRTQKSLFLRIVDVVTANDEFFQQRPNCMGRQGLSPLQKCIGAMMVLAYRTATDAVDEYLRMSATATRDALIHFLEGVISCFGGMYLRRPNEQDLARLLYVGVQRGFPCMHWDWKNCPNAWAGQYSGRSGKPTIILSPKINYAVNGHQNDRAYYLTDGIYPSWAAFVKSITTPVTRKHKLFAQHQVAARKDVERAFGVLQAHFAFIRRPCLIWDRILMEKILMACIIMDNMIVEDERDTYQNNYDPTEFLTDLPSSEDVEPFHYLTERIASLSTYMPIGINFATKKLTDLFKGT